MRILSVIGTRPEAVKMAPIVRLLGKTPGVEPLVCLTAQHRQMLDQVLDLFQIVPDVDLDLMRPDQTLAGLTASIFEKLDPVLEDLRPDWLLVQGDTTTVMAAALLGFYRGILVGHVEAGLRTGNRRQPFPEEINRRVASVAADLHFAPTKWARHNLLREGIPAERVIVTGNPVIDALQYASALPPTRSLTELLENLGVACDQIPLQNPRLVLVTAHRRESFGKPLESICEAIRELSEGYKGAVRFIYPVHLNPKVQATVQSTLRGLPNVSLLEPLDYLPMIQLIRRSSLVLTDSGGIQEEAPSLGVPVLVMRQTTERPEGVAAGVVRLVGTDRDKIIRETRRLLDDPDAHRQMQHAVNPYGDGHAAERIVRALIDFH